MNQYLCLAGHSDQLVTELAADMADGITLLRLVEAVGTTILLFTDKGAARCEHSSTIVHFLSK